MAEVRQQYHLAILGVAQINMILAQISERLDKIEGYRGYGDVITAPKMRGILVPADDDADTILHSFGVIE